MPNWTLSPEAELDEAITWFRRRLAISPKELAALRENARRQAFWMASVATSQRAKRIQDSLQDALAHGMTFETWRKNNRGLLARIRKDHLRTTFRNWTQTSLNSARVDYLSQPAVVKRRPYWVFDAVLDDSTSPVCVAYNGTVLPAKHPWFYAHTPPLHHNCRSSIRGLTKHQAEKLGIRKRAPAPKLTKAKAEAADMDPGTVAPQPGFGVHLIEPWEPKRSAVIAKPTRPAPIVAPAPKVKPKPPPPPRRKETTEEWVESLTPEQLDGVEQWTKGGFKAIREIDAGATPTPFQIEYGDFPDLAAARRAARNLKSALETAPQYEGTISRGIGGLTEADLQALSAEGATLDMEAISSWSVDRDAAQNFAVLNTGAGRGAGSGTIVFEVRATRNAHDIAAISNISSEGEVVVTKGARYRVVRTEPFTGRFGQKDVPGLIVHLEEI